MHSFSKEDKTGGLTRTARPALHSSAPPAGRSAWHVLAVSAWAVTSEPRGELGPSRWSSTPVVNKTRDVLFLTVTYWYAIRSLSYG